MHGEYLFQAVGKLKRKVVALKLSLATLGNQVYNVVQL